MTGVDRMARPIPIDDRDVLLAIDLQADFMPGGALAVAGGDEIVPLVNQLAAHFDNIVVTQDWHPPTHASFAASHDKAKPFDTKRLHYGDQTLWPEHCIQDTPGAALHPDLTVDRAFLILRKGMHSAVDSYSAFLEADRKTTTGLAAMLKARGVKRIFACGLATDFCVAHSALDARNEGFETFVIEDACRAIDANNSLQQAWARMNAAEVWRIQSAEILGSRRPITLDRRP
ncbi:MAG: bifunctional nicotinamidase/pyrazinamidase [Hyphomicrobiales bacterium]|nr:bifunctional nicotinamidase/pyrazinamidase [Hyphomicrobiales bacterium]